MLRLVVLQVSALLGGSDRSLLGLLKEAHRKRFEATVVLPKMGPLCSHLTTMEVPWVVVDQPVALLRQSRLFRLASVPSLIALPFVASPYLIRLSAAIRRLSPDVMYTNGIKAHVLGALLRRVLGLGIVWHVRDNWGGRLVGCLADFGPDAIIANSRATAARLRESMRRPDKVFVVHNSVDVGTFRPDGMVADVEPENREAPRIGLAAALVKLKGHELLLRAMRTVRTEFPSTKCFFIGGGIYDTVGDRGYEDELRRAVEEKGLADCVTFTGFQQEMAPWYRAMDIVVNASTRPEGFGRTLLEAMACGRAVVGPNAGGVPEFVRHRENGLLYEMGNAETLGDALLTLLRDADLRKRLGAAARATATNDFALGRNATTISHILCCAARRL